MENEKKGSPAAPSSTETKPPPQVPSTVPTQTKPADSQVPALETPAHMKPEGSEPKGIEASVPTEPEPAAAEPAVAKTLPENLQTTCDNETPAFEPPVPTPKTFPEKPKTSSDDETPCPKTIDVPDETPHLEMPDAQPWGRMGESAFVTPNASMNQASETIIDSWTNKQLWTEFCKHAYTYLLFVERSFHNIET